MGQLYLIRHGQASFGEVDYDKLSPTGWQQAAQLSRWLHSQGIDFDAVYAGTLRRHRETAEAALSHCDSRSLNHDAAFDELNANLLWQFHLPEMLRQHGERVFSPDKAVLKKIFVQVVDDWAEGKANYPELESWLNFKQRVQQRVKALCETHKPGSKVAVFTSGGPISAALLMYPHQPALPDRLHWDIANASVTVLDYDEKGIHRVSRIAEVPHLEGLPDLLTHL